MQAVTRLVISMSHQFSDPDRRNFRRDCGQDKADSSIALFQERVFLTAMIWPSSAQIWRGLVWPNQH
jgi:hypothetical protein